MAFVGERGPPGRRAPLVTDGLVPPPIGARADDECSETGKRNSNAHVPRVPTKHEVFTS